MQTFLPYACYVKSAGCLGRLHLGKQRVEGFQILRTLLGVAKGWENHPATKMWRGYERELYAYTTACIKEWQARGYKNNMVLPVPPGGATKVPWWLGDERLHSSHRSNLLRKMPEHYGKFMWSDDPAAPYWWPTQENADA